MRLALVVVVPPSVHLRLRIGQVLEPVHVQALVAQAAVQGLHVGVVDRLSRPRELQCDLVGASPRIDRSTRELAAIVTVHALRYATPGRGLAKRMNDILTAEAAARRDRKILPGEDVYDGQCTEPMAAPQLVRYKVRRQCCVRTQRFQRGRLSKCR